MSRIPASASVVLAGLLPACAAALGLGDIQPKSFLNQPLAAEIPLFTDEPAEVAGLDVTLASPEIFTRFGLTHPSQLSGLNFVVLPGAGGGVIRITSTAPVSEPFLILLLELRWPQGRLLREFTVLLDPPNFGAAVAPPLAQPETGSRAVPAGSEPMPPPESPAGAAPSSTAAATGTAGQSHVVQQSETLWSIAGRYRPDRSVSINQVMVSIYRTNPDSFAGNINRLQAGSVLQIPDRQAIEQIDGVGANEEVARQGREWQAESPARSAEIARLELVPPEEAGSTSAGAASAPAGDDTSGTSPGAKPEESGRLLAVEDAGLQALQQQLATQQGSAAAGEVKPGAEAALQPAPEVAAPATTEAVPARKAARKPAASRTSPGTKTGIVDTLLGLLSSVWLWIAAAVVLTAALLLSRRRGAAVSAGHDDDRPVAPRGSSAETRPAAVAPVSGAPSMIVHEEPVSSRDRRRPLLPADEESPLERTIGADSPLDAERTDPIAEADFHMAYGLYDQAADLLTAAVDHEPERRDLRLKLLDVLFVWENRDGFLRQAQALRERLSDSDPDWKRVAVMGQQLCPGEKLFGATATPTVGDVDLSLAGAGSSGSIDFNPGAESEGLEFDLDVAPDEGGDTDVRTQIVRPIGLVRTQEVPTLELPAAETAVTSEVPTVEHSALALTMEAPTVQMPAGEGTLETPTLKSRTAGAGTTARMPAPAALQEVGGETAEIELEDLGLDLSGFDVDEIAKDMGTGLQPALPDAPDAGLDMEFDETDLLAEGEESTAEMLKDPSLSHITLAMDKGGGADESERLISDTAEHRVADLTVTGLHALGRQRMPEDQTMTEVGTKLDLARAYLDMGDPDGARSILNEVIEEGDQTQRQEARQLLDGLDH